MKLREKKADMSKKKIFIILGVVAVIAIMIVFALKKDKGNTVDVQAEKVTRKAIVHKVTASGRVQPIVEVNVSADVAGRVVKLDVKEGDQVAKGQFLAQLDSTRYAADVKRAQQAMSSTVASLKLAKLERDQQYQLFEKKLVSELVYQSAESHYQQAESSVEQARAALTQAQDNFNKTIIRAPMSGIITRLNKEEGEIALGSAFSRDIIMSVADLSDMECLVEVNENDVVEVALGDTAEINIDALPDTTFYGIVTEIAHSAKLLNTGSMDQVTNFEVKVKMLNVPGEIRPGMSAAVDIRTNTETNALAVPIQSVTMRKPHQLKEKISPESRPADTLNLDHQPDTEPVEVVFVIVDNDHSGKKVEKRAVTTGITGENEFQILAGLKEGDLVVSGPYKAISRELEDGTAVKITKRQRFNPNKKDNK